MDPITQTALTVFCMICSWLWGKRQGIEQGALATWGLIMNAFGIVRVDFEESTGDMVFVDEFDRKYRPDELKKQFNDKS